MKGSEVVKLLLDKVGVDNDELNAFATSGALQDLEIADETAEALQSAEVMNLESAKNNGELGKYFRSKLYPEVKGELLDRVDQKINVVAKRLLNEDQLNALNEIEFTQDRVAKFGEFVESTLAEKTDDTKLKESLKKAQKEIEQLHEQGAAKEEEYKNTLQAKMHEFKNEMLRRDVYNIARDYELQDAFKTTDELKNSIYSIVWNTVTENAVPKYDESGKIRLFQKENPDMELYENNKKVEVNSLVEKAIAPYTKKSDPSPPKDNPPRHEPTKQVGEIPAALKDRFRNRV